MKKILILEGGFNEEHEISLNTAKEIKKSLRKLKISFESMIVNPDNFRNTLSFYKNDFLCFNALHGTFGEDGSVQKILEEFEFKFTHSDSLSSKLAFNKQLTKQNLKKTKIEIIKSEVLNIKNINKKKMKDIYDQYESFVIKPVSSGSSFGVKIFKNFNDIKFFNKNISKYLKLYKKHPQLLIEKYIPGRELTVTVFKDKKQYQPIAVTEIISSNPFFDYQSKYTEGYSKHILPAKLPQSVYKNCLDCAKIAHNTLNCKGVTRSDFLFDNEKIYFLEINTQPGLTPISLVPEQLKYKGISFDSLIEKLINSAL